MKFNLHNIQFLWLNKLLTAFYQQKSMHRTMQANKNAWSGIKGSEAVNSANEEIASHLLADQPLFERRRTLRTDDRLHLYGRFQTYLHPAFGIGVHFPDDRCINDELAVDAKKSHRIEEFLQFVQRVVHRKRLPVLRTIRKVILSFV